MHAVETMMYHGEVPWHGLGKQVQDAPDAATALVAAGLDWHVEGKPLYWQDEEGHFHSVIEWVANIRDADKKVLGIVSNQYVPVQNFEAFSFVDELIGTGDVRYETAGSLFGGKKIWLLARLQDHVEVLGDDVDPYLLFTNAHDGTGAVRVLMTPVRVVCNNTLNLALDEAQRSGRRAWSTIHVGNIQERLEEARRTLGLARIYLKDLMAEAERLAAIKLSDDKWHDIVEQVLPAANDSTKVSKMLREKRDELYFRAYVPDLANFKNTGWAAVNAAADFVAHSPIHRDTSTWSERNFDRIVNGHPLVDEVYQRVLALA